MIKNTLHTEADKLGAFPAGILKTPCIVFPGSPFRVTYTSNRARKENQSINRPRDIKVTLTHPWIRGAFRPVVPKLSYIIIWCPFSTCSKATRSLPSFYFIVSIRNTIMDFCHSYPSNVWQNKWDLLGLKHTKPITTKRHFSLYFLLGVTFKHMTSRLARGVMRIQSLGATALDWRKLGARERQVMSLLHYVCNINS